MGTFINLILLIYLVISFKITYSQCIPDTLCTDINNPGEVCPGDLPDGYVYQYYNQVLTIIPPASAVIGGQTVNIVKIKLTNVENLPQGLSYQCSPSNCEFAVTNPITKYCAVLQGTPTTSGTYQLKIHVVPYVNVFGVPTAMPEQVDDTSLVLIIHDSTRIHTNNIDNFFVNILSENDNYNFLINYPYFDNSIIYFLIFDITGKLIYDKKIISRKGINAITYKAENLKNGIYICRVTAGKHNVIKQFVK